MATDKKGKDAVNNAAKNTDKTVATPTVEELQTQLDLTKDDLDSAQAANDDLKGVIGTLEEALAENQKKDEATPSKTVEGPTDSDEATESIAPKLEKYRVKPEFEATLNRFNSFLPIPRVRNGKIQSPQGGRMNNEAVKNVVYGNLIDKDIARYLELKGELPFSIEQAK